MPDTILAPASFSSVQSLSHVLIFVTPWTAPCQASLSITTSQNLIKPVSIEWVMPPNHLMLCHPLPLLPSGYFPNVSVLHIRWPKYWSFSFIISSSNEYSVLISLGLTGLISLQSKGLSRVSSNRQFKSINSSALRFLYSPTLLTSLYFHVKTKTQRISNFDSVFTFYVVFIMSLYSHLRTTTISPDIKRISLAHVVHILCILWQYSLKIHYLRICIPYFSVTE